MFSSNTTQVSSGGYQISRSLRFNSADSAYLNRTPASATNRKTWTWSGWVKRSSLVKTNELVLFACRPSAYTIFSIRHSSSANPDTILLEDNNGTNLRTTQVFRDVSAWYHIVLAVDTTQATSTDRVKLYVNGSQVTAFSATTYPTQNLDMQINTANAHGVGGYSFSTAEAFDGYMTEINFIDGQALTPSSFGETNAQTGVWQPKAYSGSYGTNGFYLNFSDNSNTTAATLGKDYSGNGNNWTPNNFSVTAGAGNDSFVDSPTSYGTDTGVGGTVRGNYATMNPLQKGSTVTLTNGNLDSAVGASDGKALATIGMSSGKWYAEASNFTGLPTVGIATGASSLSSFTGGDVYSWGYYPSGTKYTNGSSSAYGASWTTTDTIGIAFDADAGTLTFYKNGTSQGTAFSSLTSGPYFFSNGNSANTLCSWNFGQRPFAYTAPSGFKALCTQNLPTPTIGATTATLASQYFNPVLYTGNGSAPRTITGVGFQPDLVWVKSRSNAYAHFLWDAVRGTNLNLFSNLTAAEANVASGSTDGGVSTSASDGFTLTAGTSTSNNVNNNGSTYVGWAWKANGSGSTNTAGSITSTVSANTTSGFSVVTYTGTGANATVGHGLGVAPRMIIGRSRTTSGGWPVYHASLSDPRNNYLVLNLTDAVGTASNYWGTTSPTSTTFSLSTYGGNNNTGDAFVMYCFAEVAGYSKFGSYTGNGSSDGVFVYTGFRPAYLLIKRTTSAYNWWILDAARGTINAVKGRLYADASDAESTTYPYVDFLSNGFKLRDADGGNNANGEPYIYACFASAPFKYSLAR